MNNIVITRVSEYSREIRTGTLCLILSDPNYVEISAHIDEDGIIKLRFCNESGETPKKLHIDCHPLGLRDLHQA